MHDACPLRLATRRCTCALATTFLPRWCVQLAFFLVATLPSVSHAYHDRDVEIVRAPPTGDITLLRGYDTRSGRLAETCVESDTGKTASGTGQPGSPQYKFVRSIHTVTRQNRLSIAASLEVGFGIGGAELSVEQSFFKSSRSTVENGAIYAYFIDYQAPRYASSAASYRLNVRGARAFESAVKRGEPSHFERECGDAVVVGIQKARSFQGFASYSGSDTASAQDRVTKVDAAARYMMAALRAGVEKAEAESESIQQSDISVSYLASGDSEHRGATTLRQFARAFSSFQAQDKERTSDTANIYVIAFDKLVPASSFDLGIPRERMRKVRAIIQGLQFIEEARNSARSQSRLAASEGERMRLASAATFLRREFDLLRDQLAQQDGCIREFSAYCDNLYHRFAAYPDPDRPRQVDGFVSIAAASADPCSTGYPVSRPDGLSMCRHCADGKEPVFLNRHEGACRYLPRSAKSDGATRLFLAELKHTRRIQTEVGVFADVVHYPNFLPERCDAGGVQCRQRAADAVCASHARGAAVAFEVWDPPGDVVSAAQPTIVYQNGNRCIPQPDAFTPVQCKTFKYVDCGGVRTDD